MWLNSALKYKYGNNEAVQKAEEILKSEIAELAKEIELNELEYGAGLARPFSSVSVRKNEAQILANERKFFIEKLLQVSEVFANEPTEK